MLQILTGSGTERPRWEVCVGFAGKHLGAAVGRIFVEKKFDENAKEKVSYPLQKGNQGFT